MNKLNLLLIFGGISPEHEVSVVTGFQVLKNINRDKYNVISVYVDKEGRWWHHPALAEYASAKKYLKEHRTLNQTALSNPGAKTALVPVSKSFFPKHTSIDVVLPAFHGGVGENGAMQGMFESVGVPYAGRNVLASALGMDKVLMKDIFKAHDIPMVPHIWFWKWEWEKDRDGSLKRINELGSTVVVKPASLGSSIAVTKVSLKTPSLISPFQGENNSYPAFEREGMKRGIEDAVDLALHFDDKVVVEKAITNLQEINCSVLGDPENARASVCEQPLSADEILSFQEKYMKGGKKMKGMASMGRKIPAPLSADETKKIQMLAIKVFMTLTMSGVVRVDFLIDRDTNTIYVNEPNTIPGSFSFYLWEASGMQFRELLDELVAIALRQHKRKRKLLTSFDTPLLEKFLES